MTATDSQPESRRQVLAAIALSPLPMPGEVRFSDQNVILALTFASLADGEQWARSLGGYRGPAHVYNGRRWLDSDPIRWRGWAVLLHASEPADADVGDLDADTVAALVEQVTGSSP